MRKAHAGNIVMFTGNLLQYSSRVSNKGTYMGMYFEKISQHIWLNLILYTYMCINYSSFHTMQIFSSLYVFVDHKKCKNYEIPTEKFIILSRWVLCLQILFLFTMY